MAISRACSDRTPYWRTAIFAEDAVQTRTAFFPATLAATIGMIMVVEPWSSHTASQLLRIRQSVKVVRT